MMSHVYHVLSVILFKLWSDDFATITAFPIQLTHLTLYLEHLADTSQYHS